MSTTGKIIGHGATLEYGDPAQTIASVESVGGPDLSKDMVEVTTFDSPNGAREYIAGLIDTGELTLGIIYTPTTCSQIYTLFAATAEEEFTITLPDTHTFTFTALCSKVGAEVPVAAGVKLNVGFKIATDTVTFT